MGLGPSCMTKAVSCFDALAPHRGTQTSLTDVAAAVQMEIPTSKQEQADVFWGVARGTVCAQREDVRSGESQPLELRPSRARDFAHGFASLAKFFPDAKEWIARVEEKLWTRVAPATSASPMVFDDQYLCSGGQLAELMVGHDRMIGDLRSLAFQALGIVSGLVCHPYDVCTWILLPAVGAPFTL